MNGNTYIGDFKYGMKHGKGRWKKKSSHFLNDDNISVSKNVHNQYDGYYELDKKHGYGEF